MEEPDEMDQISDEFVPRWTGCVGIFNQTENLDSRQNEEDHFRKHAVLGKEWGVGLSLTEYRSNAVKHLNSVEASDVVELCQAEDLAVVKFNINSGDLGIARRVDGTIKTFFRPADVQYVLRKVQSGHWGSPDIVNGFGLSPDADAMNSDPEQRYIFSRLEVLSVEVEKQSHDVIAGFLESDSSMEGLLPLIARLAECRFLSFELRRRVLSADQEEFAFTLRRRVAVANATIEGLERYRGVELLNAIRNGIDVRLKDLRKLWFEAPELISDGEMFEDALDSRQAVAFILMELRILQYGGRFRDLDLDSYEHHARRSDIYLRKHFYTLAKRFEHHESNLVAPDDFFWRKMVSVQAEATNRQ